MRLYYIGTLDLDTENLQILFQDRSAVNVIQNLVYK